MTPSREQRRCPATITSSTANVRLVRLATVNLLHGRSLEHGRCEVDDLRAAARLLDADVVGLQEVDNDAPRSGCVDQTAVVAEALGAAHWRFEPAARADYGVGLVSRVPVTEWAVRPFAPAPVSLPLLVPDSTRDRRLAAIPDEPRVAIAAILDGATGPITVVTTHLSFVPGWNVAQLRELVRWARQFPAPRVLLADLNLPGPVATAVTGWPRLARAATYPVWRPRVQLDHILGDGLTRADARNASAITLPVSDHRALVVDIAAPDWAQ